MWGRGMISGIFSTCKTKTLNLLKKKKKKKKKPTTQFLLSPAPDHHHSTFCLSDFGYSKYFMESCRIYIYILVFFFMVSLFNLA